MAPSHAVEDAARPKGPHPSYIEIAKPYVFESKIRECLTVAGVSEARDDSIRLQGVAWIDSVRKAMHLNGFIDAAAAALFTACKIEDTLKKSKEILCAAWNMKVPAIEQLTPDDSLFESHSKTIIGLERLMLEASGFDFRNRYPQVLALNIAKMYNAEKHDVGRTVYSISLDMYRTYAPLKQTTATMAFACVELAGRIHNHPIEAMQNGKYDKRWNITREEVMETLLDLVDLYTHHRAVTIVGQKFSLETFIGIRIALNQEASTNKYPRYTVTAKSSQTKNSGSTKATNGAKKGPQTPTSPYDKDLTSPISANGASKPGLKDGTVRFMLDPQRAKDEKDAVRAFFEPGEEEYEIEVPRDSRRP
ncbi:RNA polymerase II C-terminal domain kinase beta subunit [Lecanora helva]